MKTRYWTVLYLLAACTAHAQFTIDADTDNLVRAHGQTWWFDDDNSGNAVVVSNINAVATPDGALPGWAWTRVNFMVASTQAVSEAGAADVVTNATAAGPGDILAPGAVAATFTNDQTVGNLASDEDVFIGDGATLTLDRGGLMFRGGNHDIRTPPGSASGFLTSSYTSGNGTNELFMTVTDDGTVYRIFGIEIVDGGPDPLTVIVDGYVAVDEAEIWFSDGNAYSGGTIVNRVSCWGANSECFGTGPVVVRDNNAQVYLVTSSGTFTNDFYIAGIGWEEDFFGHLGALRFTGNAKLSGDIILTADARIGITSSVNTPARIEGQISGPFDLEKFQDGKIVVTQSGHTYSNTTVSGGVIQLGEPDAPATLPPGSTTLVAPGAELQGFTDYDGTVDLYGTLTPGFVHLPETMVLQEAVFRAGSTIQIDLSVEAKDIIQLGDLTVEGGTVDLNVIGELNNGTYVIMTYTNLYGVPTALSLSGDTGRRTAVLDTGTPGQIRVNVSGMTPPLTWTPTGGSDLWDLDTSTNWSFGIGGPQTFQTADPVAFSGASPLDVQLTGALTPGLVIVAGTADYTFEGTGRLIGNGDLRKLGSNTLTINNDNVAFGYDTYTGLVKVEEGILRIGHNDALGDRSVGTVILPGATLDINGKNIYDEPVYASGDGVGGIGAIVNNGVHSPSSFNLESVTLTNDTTIGGDFNWAIGSNMPLEPGILSTTGEPFNLTKVGLSQVSLRVADVDPALWGIDVLEGTLSFRNQTTGLGDPAGPMNIESNATFFISNPNYPAIKEFHFKDGSRLSSQGSPNSMDGQVEITGTVEFEMGGTVTVDAPITGAGGINKTDSSSVIFTASNSYSGLTFIDDGRIYLGNGTPGGSFGSGPVLMDFNTYIVMNRTTDASVLNPISGEGIIQLLGTNEVEFGLVDMPGPFDSTIMVIGYPGGSPRLLVTTNSDIRIERIYTAINAGEGHIRQTGGSLLLTDYDFAGPLRLGYFAGGTNVYDLEGGLLTIPIGGIDVGFHAHAVWNISGGTAQVAKVDLNAFDSTGSGTLNLNGGVLAVAEGGINNAGTPYACNLSGGTLRADGTNFTVDVEATLSYAPFLDSNGQTITMAGSLHGGGGFRKVGAGTVLITGTNDFSGTHAVFEGTLQHDGIHAGAGLCLVNSNAVLTGSGVTDADVTVTPLATLAPSPQLTIQGNVVVQGTYAVDVSGATIDQVLDIGNLDIGAGSTITVSGTLTEPSYVVMTYTARTGAFADAAGVFDQGYHVEYDDDAGEVRLEAHAQPLVGIQLVGSNLVVSWPGYAGFTYWVEHRTNLVVGAWDYFGDYTNLPGLIGSMFATNDPCADPVGFFRIQEGY